MISIIVAVYNQLEMNKLFFESLKKYTYHTFELIVIDNGSTDGSREFFHSVGARVIENNGNYSYPYCQNQGIRAAKYDIMAFLNNDIIVGVDWDKKIIDAMEYNGLEVITACGVEKVETKGKTRLLKKKWEWIKSIIGIFGYNGRTFRLMHKIMYGDWTRYCLNRYKKYSNKVIEGFVGSSVIMKRSAIVKLGMWDERIMAADFDLYIRSKKRSIEHNDIKPCHIALGILNHHFIRITLKGGYPPYVDKANLISLDAKWGKETAEHYLKDIK